MQSVSKYRMVDLISSISMGPFGSNIKTDCFVDSGVPVLNGSNLQGFKLNEDSFKYVSLEKADSLGKANAYRGDVVVTHRGTLGQIVYIPNDSRFERYVISQSQFRFVCNEKVLPEYITYYFHSKVGQHKLLANASQVGVPALARATSTFKEIEVEIPPVSIQKQIVKILSSLDSKIEINNRINGCLEAHIKYHFSRFFGSNDGQSVKIGELPVVVTDYVANGSFASLKENVTIFEEPDYAVFIRNTDLKSGSFKTYVDERAYHFLSKSTLFGGEIIVSNVGDIGSVFICPKLDKPMTLGNNIIMVKTKNASLNHFLYCWLKWFGGQRAMQGIATGSAVPKFNKTEFKGLQLKLPAQMVLKKFETQVGQMFSMSENLQTENKRLSILRDSILPKLMSGEINVDAIEIN